jgi:transposase
MGERAMAMIINGLGFIDTRLYIFSKFLKNKPIDKLIREDLKISDFNDDALGRLLDAIHTT